jgi:hypothetical protein
MEQYQESIFDCKALKDDRKKVAGKTSWEEKGT